MRIVRTSLTTAFVLAALLPGCHLAGGKSGADDDGSGGEVDSGGVGNEGRAGGGGGSSGEGGAGGSGEGGTGGSGEGGTGGGGGSSGEGGAGRSGEGGTGGGGGSSGEAGAGGSSAGDSGGVRLTLSGGNLPTVSKMVEIPDPNNQLDISHQAALLAQSEDGWNLNGELILCEPPGWQGHHYRLMFSAEMSDLIGYSLNDEAINRGNRYHLYFHTDEDCSRAEHDMCEPQGFGVISGGMDGEWCQCVEANWGTYSVESEGDSGGVRLTLSGGNLPTVSKIVEIPDPNNQLDISHQAALLAQSEDGWNLSGELILCEPPGWQGHHYRLMFSAEMSDLIGYSLNDEAINRGNRYHLYFHTDEDCSRAEHDMCEPQGFGVISGGMDGEWCQCVEANWGTYSVEIDAGSI